MDRDARRAGERGNQGAGAGLPAQHELYRGIPGKEGTVIVPDRRQAVSDDPGSGQRGPLKSRGTGGPGERPTGASPRAAGAKPGKPGQDATRRGKIYAAGEGGGPYQPAA